MLGCLHVYAAPCVRAHLQLSGSFVIAVGRLVLIVEAWRQHDAA